MSSSISYLLDRIELNSTGCCSTACLRVQRAACCYCTHMDRRRTRIQELKKKVCLQLKRGNSHHLFYVSLFTYLTRNQSLVAFFTFQAEPMPVFAQRSLPLGFIFFQFRESKEIKIRDEIINEREYNATLIHQNALNGFTLINNMIMIHKTSHQTVHWEKMSKSNCQSLIQNHPFRPA